MRTIVIEMTLLGTLLHPTASSVASKATKITSRNFGFIACFSNWSKTERGTPVAIRQNPIFQELTIIWAGETV